MPEMWFRVRWPDGAVETCYSPSSVIADHLAEGRYPIADFLVRSRAGLSAASERVRQKYGFPCSRAGAQLSRIEKAVKDYIEQPGATVVVEGLGQQE